MPIRIDWSSASKAPLSCPRRLTKSLQKRSQPSAVRPGGALLLHMPLQLMARWRGKLAPGTWPNALPAWLIGSRRFISSMRRGQSLSLLVSSRYDILPMNQPEIFLFLFSEKKEAQRAPHTHRRKLARKANTTGNSVINPRQHAKYEITNKS